MSLPWVKLHIPLLDNEDYKRFTPQAQHLYMTLLMLAGKQDKGDFSGRLETATGPITVADVHAHAKYEADVLRAALDQLLFAKFVTRDRKGTLIISRFQEKAAPLSTERTRRYRERKRDVPETSRERHGDNKPGTDIEAEVESREQRYEVLRTSALRFGTWPKEPEMLAALALIFIDRFANCRDLGKARKHLGAYTSCLAAFDQRDVTIAQAWKACENCWRAGGELPLFGGKIKSSLNFLPARQNGKAPQQSAIPRFND